MLGQVADALGEERISIRAFMAAVMGGKGFVRVVVDRPAAAKRIFAAHGWETTEDDIVEVTVPDRPGALGRVPTASARRGSTSSMPTSELRNPPPG